MVAVREIFENDKHVMVSEDRFGMIRITIGKPASPLLQTRIHSLTLKPHEQYNAQLAISARTRPRLNSLSVSSGLITQTLFSAGVSLYRKRVCGCRIFLPR